MVDPPPGNYSGKAGNSTEEAVDRIRLQVMNYMYLHAGISALLLLVVLLYFPARPASLPSVSAGEQREDFIAGIKATADLCIDGEDGGIMDITFVLDELPETAVPTSKNFRM